MIRTDQLDTICSGDPGREDHVQEVAQYLRYYEAALSVCSARLALFTLPRRQTFASRDISRLADRAVGLSRGQNDVYLHTNLHDIREGDGSERGSAAKVRAAIGAFADIDACGPKRKKPEATLCPRVEDAIWVAEEFNARYKPLRLSLLISSGYGCYPVVLFKEPHLIETPGDGARLESIGRRFHLAFDEIASERGWTGAVDYCDVAKVLRLPGCNNWKDPNNPKVVRLAHEDAARFDPADLEEMLPHQQVRTSVLVSIPDVGKGGDVEIDLQDAAEVSGPLLDAMGEAHRLFAATWDHKRSDLKDQSCSGYDLAIAGIGVACGLPNQQIANLIVANRQRFPGPKQHRQGAAYQKYLQRTIAKARQSGGTSSEEAKRQWAEVRQTMESCTPEFVGSAGLEGNPDGLPSLSSHPLPGNSGRGQASGPGITSPLEFLLAKVRATGDLKIAYDNIGIIAAMPDSKVAVAYQELKSALGSKLNYHHFNQAIKDARMRERHKPLGDQVEDPRPDIITSDCLLDEIAAQAIAALEKANVPPLVFRRGGRLVMIQPDEDGRPVIMQASEAMMRGRLARVARFFKEGRDGPKRVSPPEDLTRDVLAYNEGQFPALGVLTQVPILRRDGTVRLEPGYDPITRAYYLPTPGFRLPPIPESPSAADAQRAVQSLDEAIGQFPFESVADRANLLALLLTPVLRVAFRMNAPLILIDAPKWGTGKTLLGMVAYVLVTGAEGTVTTAPNSEEEWRKRMTSILERGSAVVILDNIDGTLRSPSLSAVLTTPSWEDRVLGRTEEVRLPNVSTWIGTGNNIMLGGEIARRVVRIRLDAKVANPAGRTGFKRTDEELLDWVRENRGELIAALFTIVRAWWAAGQPKGKVPPFGSFGTWAKRAGGILQYAGVEGFLGNLDTVQKEADEESAQWDQFLRVLAVTFHGSNFTAAEVADQALREHGLLALSFPEDLGNPREHVDNDLSSLVRRIGKALARKCGTRFGELELRIERGKPDLHTKVQRWYVAGDLKALFAYVPEATCGVSE